MNFFLFSNPEMLFYMVKATNLFIAMYSAVWINDYLPSSQVPLFSKFLMIVPVLVNMIILVNIIRQSVMLKAIHKVDFESMMEVIELVEESRALETIIRRKICSRLENLKSCAVSAQLHKMFKEIDKDGTGYLTR
jgi:hypothetical protein